MENMQIFNNPDFGEIRTIMIDGEPWFVGKDVASALGYARPTDAARNNTDSEDKGISEIATPSGIQKMLIVNESGLYSLIFGSKLDSAKKFKKWVTSEVLPSIRKTGAYGQPSFPTTIPGQIQLLAQGHVALEAKIDSVREDLEKFKNDMPILGVEESRITAAARRKGVECLGGKESPAYNDRSIRSRVYSDLYGQLRREFGVSTYKAIKRNQTDTAVTVIEMYTLPLALADTIETVNAQQTLDL